MKKIVGISLAVLILSGMTGIGTWAYFSDFESASGNVLAAGTLDLKTNDTDGESQQFFGTQKMKPGFIIGPEYVVLKNAGSLDAATLDIDLTYVENDHPKNPVNKSADETAANIAVTTLNYGGASILSLIPDLNADGIKDLYEMKNASLNTLAGIDSQSTKTFEMAVQCAANTTKQFQGDGITITINFTLNQ